jgi:hypothetical protein
MLDELAELIGFLTRDGITVEDVVARVGPVIEDPGIPLEMQLSPQLPGVATAALARYPDSGLPYLLKLTPSPGTPLTLGVLRHRFGDYKVAYGRHGLPPAALFYLEPGPRWRIVLMAETSPGSAPNEDSLVAEITLRRDGPIE